MDAEKRLWDSRVQLANEIRELLDKKPNKFKKKFSSHPGSILNAYREGDLTFDDAVKMLVKK